MAYSLLTMALPSVLSIVLLVELLVECMIPAYFKNTSSKVGLDVDIFFTETPPSLKSSITSGNAGQCNDFSVL